MGLLTKLEVKMAGYWPLGQDLLLRVYDTRRNRDLERRKTDHFWGGNSGQSRSGKMGLSRPLGEPIRAQDLVHLSRL